MRLRFLETQVPSKRAWRTSVAGAIVDISLMEGVDRLRHGKRNGFNSSHSDQFAMAIRSTFCIGQSPEDVAAALALQAIDSTIDVFSVVDVPIDDSHSEWHRVAEGGYVRTYDDMRCDPDQMLLFMDEEANQSRSVKLRRISAFERCARSCKWQAAASEEDLDEVALLMPTGSRPLRRATRMYRQAI